MFNDYVFGAALIIFLFGYFKFSFYLSEVCDNINVNKIPAGAIVSENIHVKNFAYF